MITRPMGSRRASLKDVGARGEMKVSYEAGSVRALYPCWKRPVPLISDAATTDFIDDLPKMDLPLGGDFRQACGLDLPIVAINLPHRTDRWSALTRRMSAAGLGNLVKAPAVDGSRLSDATLARCLGPRQPLPNGAPESHLSLTRPAVGCSLSHLAVWRWIITAGLPRVLVLEDDACPTQDFDASEFRDFVEHLTPGHQLVFPGCLVMEGLADSPAVSERLARLYYFNGTFSYLITPEACRTLLSWIFPLRTHIDHQLSSLFFEHRAHFSAYYAHPQFFAPDWSLRSDCYVPLTDTSTADQELGGLLRATRQTLHAEGRQLLPIANG